jgi:hypothetical protein
MHLLCTYYRYKLLAKKVKLEMPAVHVENWKPDTDLGEVPVLEKGKGFPFFPNIKEGASEKEILEAKNNAKRAMFNHGRHMFVLHLQGRGKPSTLAAAKEQVALTDQPWCRADHKTFCQAPQKLVSFYSRHGLTFSCKQTAKVATSAIMLALQPERRAMTMSETDGCFRICNGCSRYINAREEGYYCCAESSCDFDVCIKCNEGGAQAQQHQAQHPGHTIAEGSRAVTCSLGKYCDCLRAASPRKEAQNEEGEAGSTWGGGAGAEAVAGTVAEEAVEKRAVGVGSVVGGIQGAVGEGVVVEGVQQGAVGEDTQGAVGVEGNVTGMEAAEAAGAGAGEAIGELANKSPGVGEKRKRGSDDEAQ